MRQGLGQRNRHPAIARRFLLAFVPAAASVTTLGWLTGLREVMLTTLVPVVLAAAGAAYVLLPAGARGPLERPWALAALVEISAIGLAARRARSLARAYAEARPGALNALDAWHEAWRRTPGAGRVGAFVVAELVAFFFALAGLFLRTPRARGDRFAAAPGLGGTLLGLLVLLASEGLVVHLLVARASPAAAWALTALSASGALWLAGDYQLVRLRPVVL